MKKEVEVLAPAGSLDICKAVIRAGADAVYLGGSMYGARAYAGNLNKEEMLEAIDFAHLKGARIYLTVNTLLKEREINGQLIEYMVPFYEAGLDAAIVQDFGVFRLLHSEFPELPLHASTQMTITGCGGARILKECGATRIVTARELTAAEIKDIHDNVDIEIESFVHGALCYCYSGQCLLSSMNGSRSGNRGRCAQSCRLAYDVYTPESASAPASASASASSPTPASAMVSASAQVLASAQASAQALASAQASASAPASASSLASASVSASARSRINSDSERYPLSPKDMCALKILPDVIESGVYSLKIEGRMKNATYAAYVTNIYRKYADMYLECGREGYHVSDDDIKDLCDIYNRGGFSQGYYMGDKGRTMMSVERPNHMGTLALEVKDNVNGRVTFKVLEDIGPQDVFEIDADNSFSSGATYKTGDRMVVNLPRRFMLNKGRRLYRTRKDSLTQLVLSEYVNDDRRGNVPADIELSAYVGQPLTIKMRALGHEVSVSTQTVEKAKSASADAASVVARLGKLGGTAFVPGDVRVSLGDDVFLPVGWINEIRRLGTERLTESITDSYRREYKPACTEDGNMEDKSCDSSFPSYWENGLDRPKTQDDSNIFDTHVSRKHTSILVSTEAQLLSTERLIENNGGFKESLVAECSDSVRLHELTGSYSDGKVLDIYVEREALTDAGCEAVGRIMDRHMRVVAALPHIVTQCGRDKLTPLIERCRTIGIDAYLVRNLEEMELLGQIAPGADIVTDANLYCWNSYAYRELKLIANICGLNLSRITYPYELNSREMSEINIDCESELIVSSWVPVMVSKQCVRKTYGQCTGNNECAVITSDGGKSYRVVSKCDYCYSLMLSHKRLEVGCDSDIVRNVSPSGVRFEFNDCNDRVESVGDSGFKAHLTAGVE